MSEKRQGGPTRPPNPPLSSNTTPRLYLSYLVRLWSNAGGREHGNWRASLESPVTQEQWHFPDLESLFAFLRTMTGLDLAVGEEPAIGVTGAMGGKENQSNL